MKLRRWNYVMDWYLENCYALDVSVAARLLELVESKGDNWKRYDVGDQIRCIEWIYGGVKDDSN